jgi:tartrate-resistant acid phosphatase type 5
VSWGGFWLDRDASGGCRVVDDEDLDDPQRRRRGTIGAQAPSYGPAEVEVLGAGGVVVARTAADSRNWAWVEGLEPDTEYRYRVMLDGRPWADGPRWDWSPDTRDGTPRPRAYDMRLRTHTREESEIPVTFVAVGDYGVGICNGDAGRRQQQVARTLEWLAATRPVRLILALGDNIYHSPAGKQKGIGDEDDDWYFTFYEPYRYLIDHLPLYPTVGNHDGPDSESSDDRAQLDDNFHLEERFRRRMEEGRASLEPGLFYRIQIGALLELVCVDTTWGAHVRSHYFEDDDHRRWLEGALPPSGDGAATDRTWRIPFCHHPPYSAGPDHANMPEQIDRLLPLYRRAGVPLVLAGHEHNFQHGRVDGFDYVIAGAGGKLDPEIPERWEDAGTLAWAREPHCLLIEVEPDRLVVTPYGVAKGAAEPRPLRCATPAGEPADGRVVVVRRS